MRTKLRKICQGWLKTTRSLDFFLGALSFSQDRPQLNAKTKIIYGDFPRQSPITCFLELLYVRQI